MIHIKRVYEPKETRDGYRILIDRLWPRGISKEKAHIDVWIKDVAPSNTLRKWFHHDPDKWTEFKKRYRKELADQPQLLTSLKGVIKKHKTVTLLYGARDTEHNQAVVLAEFLK